MLRNASEMHGYAIMASDGHIGTVSDLLFEDTTWRVRWVVVDTGDWLPGRKVILPISVLGHIDASQEKFPVRLTKKQVEDSPDIDTARPVSRQLETSVYDYYGWSPYWSTGFYMGGYGYAAGAPMPTPYRKDATSAHDSGDKHLRSAKEITGYHIHATDGAIGHVNDVMVEDEDWSIHYLAVVTSNWWIGKTVLISPRSVTGIDWSERTIALDVDRQRVKDSPGYDEGTLIDRSYERDYHAHYGDVAPTDPRLL
jgi:sporulation protein YlmC with PRC-barrel domain